MLYCVCDGVFPKQSYIKWFRSRVPVVWQLAFLISVQIAAWKSFFLNVFREAGMALKQLLSLGFGLSKGHTGQTVLKDLCAFHLYYSISCELSRIIWAVSPIDEQ